MVEQVFAFLSQYYPLNIEVKARITTLLKTKTFKKKEYLLRESQLSNHIYFIEKGLIRIFYTDDGTEICSALLAEGGMPLCVESFFNRVPSYEFIQALEETIVWYLTYDELESIYKDFIEFNIVGRKLITEYYVLSERRTYVLRKLKAKEKYQWFQDELGHLLPRVPRRDIASYLGLTLETLSRLS